MEKILEINDFSLHFNKHDTVTTFGSLTINPGDFVLLKGRNGSGKSTLLRCINLNFDASDGKAYCSPKSGSITYYPQKGSPIISTQKISESEFTKLRQEIVEVRQDETFGTYLTPFDALCLPTKIVLDSLYASNKEVKTHYIKQLEDLVEQLYDNYKLNDHVKFSLKKVLNCDEKDPNEWKRKKLRNFSGGQQKMVQVLAGVVKARVLKSNFMLLDEPANNLDGKNKYYLNEFFKQLRRDNDNLAILMISHCHVFEGINKIMDIDYASANDDTHFIAKIIEKTSEQESLFTPHSDCIEDCGENMKGICALAQELQLEKKPEETTNITVNQVEESDHSDVNPQEITKNDAQTSDNSSKDNLS